MELLQKLTEEFLLLQRNACLTSEINEKGVKKTPMVSFWSLPNSNKYGKYVELCYFDLNT